ncbi:MAG: hypothetical protein KF712_16265 [Akkermansiaceae bacterium]|nr:hypothetical protein [Akkermansiaceae bacterium]
MSLMKKINKVPPVALVAVLLAPFLLAGMVWIISTAYFAGRGGGQDRPARNKDPDRGKKWNSQTTESTPVTIGSDISQFVEKFGDDKFIYVLLPPKGTDTAFRYFGFALTSELTMFAGVRDETVKALALLKHPEGNVSNPRRWTEPEIVGALRGFGKIPDAEWLEMDPNDVAKGYRVWADMSSLSTQGGIIAWYDESYRGLAIGTQADIKALMGDFSKSRILDLRKVEISSEN